MSRSEYPSVVLHYNKKEDAGVFIYSVVKTSPAYEKGLRAGDRIISIDGESIDDLEQCRKMLRQKGKKIKIKAISEDGTKKRSAFGSNLCFDENIPFGFVIFLLSW